MTPRAGENIQMQRGVIAVTALLATALALRAAAGGWRMAALFVVGLLLGATLYRFSFGFAYAYRRLIVQGDTRGLRIAGRQRPVARRAGSDSGPGGIPAGS